MSFDMDVSRNPEIQRLLASLRSANSAIPSTNNISTTSAADDSFSFQSGSSNGTSNLPGLGFISEADIARENAKAIRQQSTTPIKPPASQTGPAKERPVTPVVPDASTITTWSAALKHVTKYVASDEKIAAKIKRLISDQHKHERQWWNAREAIVARQSGRLDNQQKAAELLKSLGGLAVPIAASDTKADQAELEAFDKKVYKGLMDMAADFDRQLRLMGIPFYAIKHDLVILEAGKEKEGAQKGRLDKGELRELQKKMVQTLEDLFGDD